MKPSEYDPQKHIPDLSGKVILVTGGTAGIGSETVLALASHNPAHIYFSGRNEASANTLIANVKQAVPDASITFIQCDLASLASVQAAAERFKASTTRLDILICNAGVLGTPPSLTTDGYEVHFGTNHVGHALLIKLLLPLLTQTAEQQPDADVRIVNLASQAYFLSPNGTIAFDELRSTQAQYVFGGFRRYGQSKLANLLYARELAKRYPRILTMSIHPGIVSTGLTGNMSLFNRLIPVISHPFSTLTPTQGAYNQLWAATAARTEIVAGEYYEPVGVGGLGRAVTKNDRLAEELWNWTEKELRRFSA